MAELNTVVKSLSLHVHNSCFVDNEVIKICKGFCVKIQMVGRQ